EGKKATPGFVRPQHSRDRMTKARPRSASPPRRALAHWLGALGLAASFLGLGLAVTGAFLADGLSALTTAALLLEGAGLLLAALSWGLRGNVQVSAVAAIVSAAVCCWALGMAALSSVSAGVVALAIILVALLLVFFGKE